MLTDDISKENLTDEQFLDYLKRAMKTHKFTQDDIADKCGFARQSVNAILRGRVVLTLSHRILFAYALSELMDEKVYDKEGLKWYPHLDWKK